MYSPTILLTSLIAVDLFGRAAVSLFLRMKAIISLASLTPQQRTLYEIITSHNTSTFYADTVRSITFDALAKRNFLALVREQPDERDQIRLVTRITDKTRAFALQLTLSEFANFMHSEFERLATTLQERASERDYQIALNLLGRERQRIAQTALYFLTISTDEQTIYKIGVTNRPLAQRIQEVYTFLRLYFPNVAITPLLHLPHVPFVEGYFKAKFAQHSYQIGQATEYFSFSPEALLVVQTELNELAKIVVAGFSTDRGTFSDKPPQTGDRSRFRAVFERYEKRENRFTGWYEPLLLLVDLTDIATGKRIADWQWFAYGKTFEALGELQPGAVLEFNASLEGTQLKRPTKLVRITV